MMKKTLIFPPCHGYQHHIKVQITADKIPQHVHDGIHCFDCIWTLCVVANLCMLYGLFISVLALEAQSTSNLATLLCLSNAMTWIFNAICIDTFCVVPCNKSWLLI